jgi:hypothetical protein
VGVICCVATHLIGIGAPTLGPNANGSANANADANADVGDLADDATQCRP